METSPPPVTPPPSYETPRAVPPKKGLGTGAKIGIGCGAIVLLIIIAGIVASVMFGGKIKQIAEEAQSNPTRATVTTMVSVSGGKIQIVAEDDVNKRYTVKDSDGKLITVYWDETKKAPVTIQGDFSDIPSQAAAQP